ESGRSALKGELDELVRELRAKGARPVLVCAPFEFQVRKESADRSPEGALGMICSGLDLPYYPARPTLRHYLSERSSLKPAVFLRGDTFHLNAKGHELVAEDLFLSLERAGLLP
ncbi:MAG: SGNH/GDSL hydrolase family protein, partial [Planctomycetes bacterium]|nr:SGNH/GDSL hydrolase family protein [Planctomycetota bacterium]